MRKTELLIPASSLEVLKVAVKYGADAVYIGGEAFGLRAKAKNFSMEEMKEGVEFAHSHGKKVYVTSNILAHNYDLEGARKYFRELKDISPDALIISDPGMFTIAREELPEMEIHISTQANNTNYETYKFWYKMGAKRVVSARELSLKEIKEIRENIPDDMEIETFIHGAMCISYSGRCLLSAFLAGRDANKGACTHPCRWKYYLMEETREGEYMPVFENERGTYIFNSKDLCMIEHIPEIIDAGIDSFKIEGRMKTALYVATVTRTYRMAIDDYLKDPEYYKSRIDFYKSEIQKCTYRQYTTGFFFGKPDENTQIYDSNTYVKEYIYLGMIEKCFGNDWLEKCGKGEIANTCKPNVTADKTDAIAGETIVAASGIDFADNNIFQGKYLYQIEQRNKFSVGDEIEIMRKNGENLSAKVLGMFDEEMNPIENCPHPKQKINLVFDAELEEFDILRVKGE